MNPSLSKRRVIKKTSPMNKSLYTSSITFKSFEKTILFSTDGSDEEYETAEDVHDEINPAASTSGEVKSEHPPVYIPEDIPIPDRFELRESRAFPGLGVWTKQLVQKGEKFGPFSGVLSFTSNNSATSWKVGLYTITNSNIPVHRCENYKKHGNLLCIYNSHKSFIKDNEEINSGFDK